MQKKDITHHALLFEVLASLSDPEAVRILLEDLCTTREIDQMCQRIEAARMLLDGQT